MIRILNAFIIPDTYLIIITFTNLEIKIVDFNNIINLGIYNKLKDYNLFKNMNFCKYHISWDNGDIDYDADSLYEIGIDYYDFYLKNINIK